MKPDNAEEMQPSMTLCDVALEEQLQYIGPAWVYNVYVSKAGFVSARTLARGLAAQVVNNPFAPYLNLHIAEGYVGSEWSIAANGKHRWSYDF